MALHDSIPATGAADRIAAAPLRRLARHAGVRVPGVDRPRTAARLREICGHPRYRFEQPGICYRSEARAAHAGAVVGPGRAH